MQETALSERGPGRRADLADPRSLADLGNLEFIARAVVEGFLIGLHRSPYRGFSVEFAENRPYNIGDDPRHVDWKMYARSDRYYVKQYEEETNLRGYLVLDLSGSMAWSSEPVRLLAKADYARLLAAALAHLLLRQGDAVGLLTFDERVRDHVVPRGKRSHLATLLRSLERVSADGRTDAEGALRDVAVRLPRRGLVILLSDLLVDREQTRRALRYLRHRGNEVLVVHVMDPAERDLPSSGDAVFLDPESGEELRTNSAALRRLYRESVARAVAGWRRECLAMGADYDVVTTDTPLGLALRRYLDKRSRLG